MDTTDVRPSKRARHYQKVGALVLWKESMDQAETDFQTYQRLALARTLRRYNIADDLALAVADHIVPLYAQYVAWKHHRERTFKEQYNLPVLFDNVQALNPTAQRAVVRAHVFRDDLQLQGYGRVIPRLTPADARCLHPVVCTPQRTDTRIRRIKPGEAPKQRCKRTWTDCPGRIVDGEWYCIECCLQ
jgi:hypothetical protein